MGIPAGNLCGPGPTISPNPIEEPVVLASPLSYTIVTEKKSGLDGRVTSLILYWCFYPQHGSGNIMLSNNKGDLAQSQYQIKHHHEIKFLLVTCNIYYY